MIIYCDNYIKIKNGFNFGHSSEAVANTLFFRYVLDYAAMKRQYKLEYR